MGLAEPIRHSHGKIISSSFYISPPFPSGSHTCKSVSRQETAKGTTNMKTYNIDGIKIISKATKKKEVSKDNWNIFDLPQETTGTDWLGIAYLVALITLLALIVTY